MHSFVRYFITLLFALLIHFPPVPFSNSALPSASVACEETCPGTSVHLPDKEEELLWGLESSTPLLEFETDSNFIGC
jgi:hypothetical protein